MSALTVLATGIDLKIMLSKEDILEEIRKTAKENEGTPLGVSRFQKETGIKPYDWQKYWARFGDAQKEAGFKPNTLVEGYTDEYLFEKLVILIRKLGKIPTYREVDIMHRQDKSFPGAGVYYRLGNISEQVSKLLSYSRENDYQDIIEVCQTYLENLKDETLSVDEPKTSGIGSVYLVKSGRYYKIGKTNNMDRRHQEITIILPEGLTLIHEIKTDDPSGIEAYWHRRFETKRKNGEWFDLNSSDVKSFKRWRKIV